MIKAFDKFCMMTLCCACAIAATAASAQAASPGRGGFGSFGFGHHSDHFNDCFQHNGNGNGFFGWGGGGWGLPWGNEIPAYADAVPYFALHPPVYYSYPVARPYGDSPYPAPPGSYTATPVDSEPKIIMNPYVTPNGVTPAPSNAAPQNGTPTPPAPASPSPSSEPKSVKPAAARVASLSDASDSAAPSPSSQIKVFQNPFVN